MWATPYFTIFLLALLFDAASGYDTWNPPDELEEYMRARDGCVWQHVEQGHCYANTTACVVKATLPEGEGVYRFIRTGPFTTTGGNQVFSCDYPTPAMSAPLGSYLTRSMAAPIEPKTGMVLSYPPVHLHHAITKEGSAYFPRSLTDEITENMPWLYESFTVTSSSEECPRAYGGVSCLNIVTPKGYGLQRARNEDEGAVDFIMEDVRRPNSPPMSTTVEYGHFFVTKPNPKLPPMRKSVGSKMGLSGGGTYNTYALKYNTANYMVGTFYMAFKVEMYPYKAHLHSLEGDEMWWVLGTQEDLGIPEHLRAKTKWQSSEADSSFYVKREPVHMQEGESLDEWKKKFEENLLNAGEQWEKRPKTQKKKQDHAGKMPDYFVRYNHIDPQPAVSKPTLLCKHYGAVEHVTEESIESDKVDFQNLMQHGGHQRNIVLDDRAGSKLVEGHSMEKSGEYNLNKDPIGEDGYSVPPGLNTRKPSTYVMPPKQEYYNLFQGVLPGDYYRFPRSSSHATCSKIVAEAGDYFTIVAFNVARTNPKYDTQEYYGMPVKNQHTLFFAIMHLPDVPWFQ